MAVAVAVAASGMLAVERAGGPSGPPDPAGRGTVDLARRYGRLPLGFVATEGGAGPGAGFVARGRGYTLALTPASAEMALGADAGAPARVVMHLVGADPAAEAAPGARLPGSTNFLLGRDPAGWRTGVPSFGSVRYRGVYPGVDVVYHGDQAELEYDFVVAPGVDPGVVALAFDGVDDVRVDRGGDLVLSVPGGEVRQRRPLVYQEVAGRRRLVAAGYTVGPGGRVGFETEPYDRRLPLVIDPVLAYATYLGGSEDDEGHGITVDAAGNAWITGVTPSFAFPTAGAQQQRDTTGAGDAFVAKLRPDGTGLDYSTYLGGSGRDEGLGVDVDDSGAAYVVGATASADFPTVSALQGTNRGDGDAFVAKLRPDGAALVYSTYLGGSGRDVIDRFGRVAAAIAVGPTGKAHVTGPTRSADFPVVGAIQPAKAGLGDAFVAKLGVDGDALGFSTYLGGGNEDIGTAIAVDPAGGVLVAGSSESGDFPTTPGAFRTAAPGNTDAFVARLEPTGSPLTYSTFLGGTGFDTASALAVDATGAAYVAGLTTSGDFPVAPAGGAFQDVHRGGGDAFVATVDPTGGALPYATYLGGTGIDGATGIAVWSDPTGGTRAVVTGDTTSADFPLASPVQAAYGGSGAATVPGGDAFVTELDPSGTQLGYSTYLGGTSGDSGAGVGVDAGGNAYVVGRSASADFPTIGAVQPASAGGWTGFDAFVAKFSRGDPALPAVTAVEPASAPAGIETEVVLTGRGVGAATAVLVGDRSVSFRALSPGRLVAVAPAGGEGTSDVRVVTPAGTSAPSPFARFTRAEGGWRATAAPAAGLRVHHTATVLGDGSVLVTGGCAALRPDGCVPATFLSTVEVFDPAGETWRAAEPLPDGRYGHTATLLADGGVLVAGGFRATGPAAVAPAADALLYRPGAGWRPLPPLAEGRAFHTATVLGDGSVLVVGGQGAGGRVASSERFDPSTESWTRAATNSPHARHTATPLPDGRVLVVGGDRDPLSCDGCPPPPEVFDPAAGAWSTAPAEVRRFGHAATLLSGPAAVCGTRCGQVLVTGGLTDTNTFRLTANADLFNPGFPPAGRWAPTRPLPAARATHTATRLDNGKVLLAGGGAGRAAPLYDPAAGRWGSAGYALAVRAGATSAAHTATVLDRGACGANCGKVLLVGASASPVAELYTPRPSVGALSPAQGPGEGGTAVVVSGSGFANNVRGVTFGGVPAAFAVESPTRLTAVAPAGAGAADVVVVTDGGVSLPLPYSYTGTGAADAASAANAVAVAAPVPTAGEGYRLVASDGGVFVFGAASFLGSTGALRLNQPVVGTASTPSGKGYWMVARDGGVFAFGDAGYFGSTGSIRLNQPIVGMAPTPSGRGYWIVGSDGGVFAFGDARFFGSTGGIRMARPVVGITASPSGGGYRLVAADGGVFAFGDARFHGSTGALRLTQPVVGMAATGSGAGYWLVAADGGVFAFGDARFHGSTGGSRINRPVVALARSGPAGGGYWLVASDGGVFAFGDARFHGSTGAIRLNQPVVAVAAL